MHEAMTLAIPTIVILLALFWQSNRFESRFNRLDSRIDAIDAKIDSKIDSAVSSLRLEIQAARAESHNDIAELTKVVSAQGERIARLEVHAA